MTVKALIESLLDYPLNAEVEIEAASGTTSLWAIKHGRNPNCIELISNDDLEIKP